MRWPPTSAGGTTLSDRSLAGPPVAPVAVPDAVDALAGGAPVEAVWVNQLGGITFRVGDDRFVKWQPPGTPVDLGAEADRLGWLASFVAVPTVLARGHDDAGSWLVTRALPGTTAVDERWKADPAPVVDAIGRGLRRFHDSVPVEGCPFDWSVSRRASRAGVLADPPPVDRLVVCHGDACAPNTLVDGDGRFVAHVDVGAAGVADRWADLAVASWSLDWNFGPGWDDRFFAAYGVPADAERTAFYRWLWER